MTEWAWAGGYIRWEVSEVQGWTLLAVASGGTTWEPAGCKRGDCRMGTGSIRCLPGSIRCGLLASGKRTLRGVRGVVVTEFAGVEHR
jgi:hypothetical protein